MFALFFQLYESLVSPELDGSGIFESSSHAGAGVNPVVSASRLELLQPRLLLRMAKFRRTWELLPSTGNRRLQCILERNLLLKLLVNSQRTHILIILRFCVVRFLIIVHCTRVAELFYLWTMPLRRSGVNIEVELSWGIFLIVFENLFGPELVE